MEINTRRTDSYFWLQLRSIRKGSCVFFQSQFHQDMTVTDPYIVVDASAYPDRPINASGRIAVVNLRNGKLSYLLGYKQVRTLDAEVFINE